VRLDDDDDNNDDGLSSNAKQKLMQSLLSALMFRQ